MLHFSLCGGLKDRKAPPGNIAFKLLLLLLIYSKIEISKMKLCWMKPKSEMLILHTLHGYIIEVLNFCL